MPYRDHSPVGLHPNDTDVIREVRLVRYIRYDSTGKEKKGQFVSESAAKTWAKQGDTIQRIERSIYCLVDKDGHRRSYWCGNKDQAIDFAVAYEPDKRPDFGEDEYEFP